MAKLGDLFIELGIAGDVKELEEAVKQQQAALKVNQAQLAIDNLRRKTLTDLKKLQTETAIKNKNASSKAEVKYNNENAALKRKTIIEGYVQERSTLFAQRDIAMKGKQIVAGKALAQNLGSIVTGIGAFVGALAGAAFAINKFTNELVQSNQAMLNLTRTSDISLGTFQKWDSVGKMLGVQNAAQQLEGLNQRLFELRLTGEGARGFQLAGINPVGDAEDVLEQLRGRVAGMNDTSASYLLQQMGLDPQMLHLLRMSRDEFEALGQTIKKYQLTEEQRADIQKMNAQLKIAGIQLQYLKDRAILAIMPLFVDLVKSFARVTEMLIKWGKAIKDANVWWRGLITGIVYRLATLKSLQLFFKGLNTALGQVITKIPIFGKLLGSIGGWAAKALFPLTALYLLLDDLAVYFEGGDSLIGRVLNWGQEKGGEIGEAFKKMFGGDFSGGASDLASSTQTILDDILKAIERLTDIVANFLTLGLWDKIKGNNSLLSANPALTILNYEKALVGKVTGGAAGYEGELPDITHRGIVSPATEQMINNNTNTVTNNNSNPQINQTNYIQTNQPAYDIARELGYINYGLAGT